MSVNPSGWRPEAPVTGDSPATPTVTGNRALMLEEPLVFEIGSRDETGVDLEPAKTSGVHRLAALTRH